MHKSIIVFFSLLVILLPVGNSFNISNANAIADFDNKVNKKQVSVSSLKCNNINVNVNGLELDVLPPFLANSGLAAEAIEGETNTNSFANNGDGSQFNDFRFSCINNNNNTVVEEQQPEPTEPTTTTLTVTKLVTCEDTRLTPVNGPTCANLLGNITENQFNITVEDFIGSPSEFAGSETGTTVTLNPSNYTVTETPDDSVAQEIATIRGNITGPNPSFTGDCRPAIPGPFEAIGTISAGESQTCNIENHFVINEIDSCEACFNINSTLKAAIERVLEVVDTFIVSDSGESITIPGDVDTIEQLCPLLKGHTDVLIDFIFTALTREQFQAEIDALIECLIEAEVLVDTTPGLTASNMNTAEGLTSSFSSQPITAPGTTDSPELTTTEKLSELKTQWLNQLP